MVSIQINDVWDGSYPEHLRDESMHDRLALEQESDVQQTSLRWYVKKVLSQKQSVLK